MHQFKKIIFLFFSCAFAYPAFATLKIVSPGAKKSPTLAGSCVTANDFTMSRRQTTLVDITQAERIDGFVYDRYELDGLFTRTEIEELKSDDAKLDPASIFYFVYVDDLNPEIIRGVMRIVIGNPIAGNANLPFVPHFQNHPAREKILTWLQSLGWVVEFGRLATAGTEGGLGLQRIGIMLQMIEAGVQFTQMLQDIVPWPVHILGFANTPDNFSLYQKVGTRAAMSFGQDHLLTRPVVDMYQLYRGNFLEMRGSSGNLGYKYEALLRHFNEHVIQPLAAIEPDGNGTMGKMYPSALFERAELHIRFRHFDEAYKDVKLLERLVPNSLDIFRVLWLRAAVGHTYNYLDGEKGNWQAGLSVLRQMQKDPRYKHLDADTWESSEMIEAFIYLEAGQWELLKKRIAWFHQFRNMWGPRMGFSASDDFADYIQNGTKEQLENALDVLLGAPLMHHVGEFDPRRFELKAMIMDRLGRPQRAAHYRTAAQVLKSDPNVQELLNSR